MTKMEEGFPRELLGHKVIRTRETEITRDFSYSDEVYIIEEVYPNGELLGKDSKGKKIVFSRKFNDRNWKLFSRVKNVPDNPLNKWKGKKIVRTVPALTPTTKHMDRSYSTPVTLIIASKYHLIIEVEGERRILNYLWANPKEWKLAE